MEPANQNNPNTQIKLTPEAIPAALAQYQVTAEVISGIQQYAGFQITDKPTYDTATKAAAKIRKIRTSIEAKRKELKAPAIEFGNAVDAEAKRLTSLIQPVENHLLAEVKRVDDQEAARKQELHRQRSAELQATGFLFDGRLWMAGLFTLEAAVLAEMPEDEFRRTFDQGVKYLEGERARKEAEDRRRREEEQRLAEERRKIEQQAAEVQAKLARLAELEAKEKLAGMQQGAIDADFDRHGNLVNIKSASIIAPAPSGIDAAFDNAPSGFAELQTKADPFAAFDQPTQAAPDRAPKIDAFERGYEAFRTQMLGAFEEGIRRTREEWIQLIINMKPSPF